MKRQTKARKKSGKHEESPSNHNASFLLLNAPFIRKWLSTSGKTASGGERNVIRSQGSHDDVDDENRNTNNRRR